MRIRSRLAGLLLSSVLTVFVALLFVGPGPGPFGIGNAAPAAQLAGGEGYWLVGGDGEVYEFGDAESFGSAGDIDLNEPIVGMAPTPFGDGYWLVATDGGIFGFGDAAFHGSTGAISLNEPIVGMAATPTGDGYWLVAEDGGIFAFGDAAFHGSTGGMSLNSPIASMAASGLGDGYWLVAEDGGIFAFGDAAFHGSAGAIDLDAPVVAMAPTPVLYFNDIPKVAFSGGPADGVRTKDTTPTYSGNASSDPEGAVESIVVSVDGGAFSSRGVLCGRCGDAAAVGWSFTAPALGDGRHTLRVRAVDDLGDTSAIAARAVVVDTEGPTATVGTKSGQGSPTKDSPIDFTVVFSEPVTGFTAGDVTIGGTAGGTKTAVVSGSGSTYNVAVSGMTSSAATGNTVTLKVPAGKAFDAAGNGNRASNTTSVVYDTVRPTVPTITKATTQNEPSNDSPIDFTVTFSEPVSDFDDAGDVTAEGTAGGLRAVAITKQSGTTYNVAVSGMASPDGTVTLKVLENKATDLAGNLNTASATATLNRDTTGPKVAATRLTNTDATSNAAWDAVGDKLRIDWNEVAVRPSGDGALTQPQVNALLGSGAVAFDASATPSTVTLAGSGTNAWVLTVGGADLDDGVNENDATNGTANAGAVDGLGNTQAAATGVTFGVGPRLTGVALTAGDAGASTNSVWNAVGDVLTLDWNEAATHAGGNANLTEAQVESLLDAEIAYAATGTSVALAGSGTDTWMLTIGGAALTDGVAVGDNANGTNNSAVTDAATGGSPQVPTTGVTVADGLGPAIQAVGLTRDDGAGHWNAVNDVLTVVWTEDATRVPTGAVTVEEVEALLGVDLTFHADTTVAIGTTDADRWTLTIGGAALTLGVSEGQAVPGTANAKVIDDDGAAQRRSSATLDVGPRIAATRLTVTDGLHNTAWREDNDELTIEWSKAATWGDPDGNGPRAGGNSTITADEAGAVLGTTVAPSMATITLAGSGTDEWTLTVDPAALTDGVIGNDATDGGNNAGVTDGTGFSQVKTSGRSLGVGPRITSVKLTLGNGTDGWNKVGEVLTVAWNEDATRVPTGAVTAGEVAAMLGVQGLDFGPDGAVAINTSDPGAWTLTITGGDLAAGISLGSGTNGTNNASVADAAGNPQVVTTGRTLVDSAGPVIVATRLTNSAGGALSAWDAVGDELSVTWSEAAHHLPGTTLTAPQVNAILGTSSTPVVYGGVGAGASTVTLTGNGSDSWKLTIGQTALDTGLTDGTATNGSNNANVADSTTTGNPQTPASGVMFGVGPRISSVRLTTLDDVDNTWKAVGEVLTVTWNEAAHHTPGTTLSASQVNAILGTSVVYGSFGLSTSTVTLTGDGTATWKLTIGGRALETGVAKDDDDTNGTNNANVADAATAGNPQLTATGKTMAIGPRITATSLFTSVDGDRTFDAVGEQMTVTWNEAAHHTPGTTLSVAQVNAVLGTSVVGPATTTVTLAGSGTMSWTLTVAAAPLSTGVTEGDATNGSNNNNVADAATGGNPQVPAPSSAGEVLSAGPVISSAQLVFDDGTGGWNAVGDKIDVEWNVAASHSDTGGTLSIAQVNAVLGTALAGSGTVDWDSSATTWTLEVKGSALTTGLADGGAVVGTNNSAVTDAAGNRQLLTSSAVLGVGPRITATRLTETDADAEWDQVGDELTIIWNEAASRPSNMFDEAAIEALLGVQVTAVPGTTFMLQDSDAGTARWRIVIGGVPGVHSLNPAVDEGDETNGPDPDDGVNAQVTDGGDNPQVPTTGVVFAVGPRVASAALSTNTDTDTEWDAVGDVVTIQWNEAATFSGGNNAQLSGSQGEQKLEAILGLALGSDVDFGTSTKVVVAGSGTDKWMLTVAGEAMPDGVATGDAVNGTNNDDVTDASGAPQVPTSGKILQLPV